MATPSALAPRWGRSVSGASRPLATYYANGAGRDRELLDAAMKIEGER
jgi:hypothetical protein